MNCKDVKNLISPYIDAELPEISASSVRQHLEICRDCRQEYESMLYVSNLCKSAGKDIMTAPEGFKDAVMQKINKKEKVVHLRVYEGLVHSWKKVAASAAAIAVLAYGSFAFVAPALHVADNGQEPAIIQPAPNVDSNQGQQASDNIPGETVNPVPNDGDLPDENNPGNKGNDTPDSLTPPRSNGKTPADGADTSVKVLLLENERNIKTTFLQIEAGEYCPSPAQKAYDIAVNSGATAEIQGEQTKEDKSYAILKISVSRDKSADLVTKLSNLGSIISEDAEYTDFSAAYDETYQQFTTLTGEYNNCTDPARKAQLEAELNACADKLGEFKKQAKQETIVLWLEI